MNFSNLPNTVTSIHHPVIIETLNKRYAVFSGAGWFEIAPEVTIEHVRKRWVPWKTDGIELPSKCFEISSVRTGEKYNVTFKKGQWSCNCTGFTYRRNCKHIKQSRLSKS